MQVSRREFIASSTALVLTNDSKADIRPALIIDTHVHFYDTGRPGGVPWPPRNQQMESIYRPILPPELEKIVKPLGINGVIEVEASGLLEDNQYILNLADQHPFVLGTCGDLEAGKPGFAKNLERFAKDKRFFGIRCSNLWGRDFAADTRSPAFIADMKLLAQSGLEMDFYGGPGMLPDLLRLSDAVPELRIVIDHLPFREPTDAAERAVYEKALHELAMRQQVYAKVSGEVGSPDINAQLDRLWEMFGAVRLIYGSNWPPGAIRMSYETKFKILYDYFVAKGQEAADGYFWRNSQAAYRWSLPNDSHAHAASSPYVYSFS